MYLAQFLLLSWGGAWAPFRKADGKWAYIFAQVTQV